MLKNTLKFFFFLAIGVGLVYLIVRHITPQEWDSIKQAAIQANYLWVALTIAISAFSHWLRALRWKMLIEPTGKAPKISNTFFSLMIGYMANYALPRLGEVTRCGVLSKYEKMPFVSLLGTVITERAIDLLALFLLFVTMLLLSFKLVYSFVKNKAFTYVHDEVNHIAHINLLIVFIAIACACTLIILFIWKKAAIKRFVGKHLKNLGDGIKSVSKLKRPGLFWTYSVLMWGCYWLCPYFCFFCFPESSHLTLSDALVVLIFGTLGIIITPGGTGAYQMLVIKVFTRIFFISFAISFTLTWIIWGSQVVLIVFLGLLSLLLLPILNRNEKHRTDTIKNN